MKLLDHLVDTTHALAGRVWRPSPAVAFVVDRPKAREILAADFSDRVVHHLLVPGLERLFEPVFIHDCYSNRRGKGTHAAVDRLQEFLRQGSAGAALAAKEPIAAKAAPTGGVKAAPMYYLQLDIANFFNSIDRRRLFAQVRARVERDARRRPDDARFIGATEAEELLWLTRTLLTGNAAVGAHLRGDPASFARVPPHKRLANAPPEKGLPIGNLTSQFFANVYLNELDQFVKHTLKVRHYVRYVDDFILLSDDPEQLARWREAIKIFLADRLGLALRDAGRLRPATDGIDFLGYIIRRDYRLVRRRVVNHLLEKLREFERRAGAGKSGVTALAPAECKALRATLASYLGHFRHANSRRLAASIWRRHAWLADWFDIGAQGQLIARYAPQGVASLRGQWRFFRRRYPGALVLMHVGNGFEVYAEDARRIETLHNHGGRPIGRAGAAKAATRDGFVGGASAPMVASGQIGAEAPPTAARTGCAVIAANVVSTHRQTGIFWPLDKLGTVQRRLKRQGWSWVYATEDGWLKGGLKRRVLRGLHRASTNTPTKAQDPVGGASNKVRQSTTRQVGCGIDTAPICPETTIGAEAPPTKPPTNSPVFVRKACGRAPVGAGLIHVGAGLPAKELVAVKAAPTATKIKAEPA